MVPDGGKGAVGPAADSQARRKRIATTKPSSDYCRTCRLRKVKCDGARPSCARCRNTGRVCEGYISWELKFRANARDSSREVVNSPESVDRLDSKDVGTIGVVRENRMSSEISAQAVNRAQLLSAYLEDRFAGDRLAAPAAGHIPRISLPHILATMDVSTPLVRHAIECMGLTNLANKPDSSDVVLHTASRSRGQLLGMLHHAVAVHGSKEPICSSQSIIICIMLISLMPPLEGDSELFRHQNAVHLEGAIQFMAQYGPAVLTDAGTMNVVLMRQIQFLANSLSIGRRKEMMLHQPSWASVPRILLAEDAAVYRAVGWLPKSHVAVEQVQWEHAPTDSLFPPKPTASERNIARDVFGALPRLLEAADKFVAARDLPVEALDKVRSLVRQSHHVQETDVRPSLLDGAAIRAVVSNADLAAFNWQLEEHRYLFRTSFISEHYRWTNPQYAFTSAAMRSGSMSMDAALLQIICHGIDAYDLPPDWTGVCKNQVERRAYRAAYEVCQHVHYFSQRSLTATNFIFAFLYSAKSVFECLGASVESEWCQGCLDAISLRVRRVERVTASLCPVVESAYKIAEGTRWKPCRKDRIPALAASHCRP